MSTDEILWRRFVDLSRKARETESLEDALDAKRAWMDFLRIPHDEGVILPFRKVKNAS